MNDNIHRDLERIALSVQMSAQAVTLAAWEPSASPLIVPLSAFEHDATSSMAAFIYANYYAHDPSLFDLGSRDPLLLTGARHADRRLFEALRDANPGEGYFDPGWRIVQRGRLEALVQKDGLTLQADPLRHFNASEQAAAVGDVVHLRFPKDALRAAPGFYLAFANAGPPRAQSQTRIYLNLEPTGAPAAFAALLTALLELGCPYIAKVAAFAEGFARRDNTVLYVERAHFDRVWPVVECIYSRYRTHYRSWSPGFVRELRPGVGVADDVPEKVAGLVSFGQHRSRLVSEAISQLAIETPSESPNAILHAISAHLRSAGLDPARPHLNTATSLDYGASA